MTKTKTITATLITLTLAGALGACGSAQLVQGHHSGGKLVLSGGYMPAMGEARMLMLEHCDGRFNYVEEGQGVDFTCTDKLRATLATPDALAAQE